MTRMPWRRSRSTAKSSSPLDDVDLFIIPRSVALGTLDVLSEAGAEGYEAFVVWGGVTDGETLTFTSMIRPKQTGHRTPSGLLVTVDGSALFDVNKEFYERGEILAGQVHSHPATAYHSDTDDCFSLVTMIGALSIVVPDFAAGGLDDVANWVAYRLAGPKSWASMGTATIRVVPDEDL